MFCLDLIEMLLKKKALVLYTIHHWIFGRTIQICFIESTIIVSNHHMIITVHVFVYMIRFSIMHDAS